MRHRLLGLPPEYGLLRDLKCCVETHPATAMTNAATPTTFTFQQPKEAPKCHSSAYEVSQEWLDTFERVASYNGWLGEEKLRNVFFSLEASAHMRFENQETTLTSWDLSGSHAIGIDISECPTKGTS